MSLPFTPHLAYIGPGAGFAFLGSFLTLLGGLILGLISVLLWPFRIAWAALAGRQGYKNAKIKKLIFLGLDGLDPRSPSATWPKANFPISVAFVKWVVSIACALPFPPSPPSPGPARHSMFDFLNRNLRSHMPELSCSRVRDPERVLSIGKYRIPLSRSLVEMRRKSRTFWQFLGQHQIASTILRVPITFPPENFNGRMLSAMCTPDLLGTQGTFALYGTRTASESMEGGNRFPLNLRDKLVPQ